MKNKGYELSVLVGKPREREHLEDLGIMDDIITIQQDGRMQTGFIWLRTGTFGELLYGW
jgi:hypothetical protein